MCVCVCVWGGGGVTNMISPSKRTSLRDILFLSMTISDRISLGLGGKHSGTGEGP